MIIAEVSVVDYFILSEESNTASQKRSFGGLVSCVVAETEIGQSSNRVVHIILLNSMEESFISTRSVMSMLVVVMNRVLPQPTNIPPVCIHGLCIPSITPWELSGITSPALR